MSTRAGEALLAWGRGDTSGPVAHGRPTPSSQARTLCSPGALLTRTPRWLVPFTDLSPHGTDPSCGLEGPAGGENRRDERAGVPASSQHLLPPGCWSRLPLQKRLTPGARSWALTPRGSGVCRKVCGNHAPSTVSRGASPAARTPPPCPGGRKGAQQSLETSACRASGLTFLGLGTADPLQEALHADLRVPAHSPGAPTLLRAICGSLASLRLSRPQLGSRWACWRCAS